ncbi:MAG: GntR family transcriptional regulator [Gemmatimonadota bacterium]|nr:GntR family transcriptional regulator [Gemmatimonadota bacterium]
MLTITIDRELGDAVYAQVAVQIRQLVASGALRPGTPIPSVRQLSRDLGVSLNTIARAYRMLEAEGFLVIRDRAGVTVAAPAEKIDDSVRSELLGELRAIVSRLRQAGIPRDELLHLVSEQVGAGDGARKGTR